LYRSGEKTGDGSSVTCSWFSAKINKSSVFTWYGRWFTCLWSCTKNRLTYWRGLEEPQALLQRLGIFEPWLGTFCTKREPPRLQAPGAPQRPRRRRLAWCQIPKKTYLLCYYHWAILQFFCFYHWAIPLIWIILRWRIRTGFRPWIGGRRPLWPHHRPFARFVPWGCRRTRRHPRCRPGWRRRENPLCFARLRAIKISQN
jgi:hypothetical protein